MKERPILFSCEMVRAVLNGTKTQTRRVIKPQPPEKPQSLSGVKWGIISGEYYYAGLKCPYGVPGDRLWVRETFTRMDHGSVYYKANGEDWYRGKWTPSIHMPRWASRIDLEVLEVRVERLQDISEDDATAEGVTDSYPEQECNSDRPYAEGFEYLWDSINGKPRKDGQDISWSANPWVWVVEFKKLCD